MAGEPELAEHAVLFQTVVLLLAHRRLFAEKRDPARRAAGIASASVADIHAGLLDELMQHPYLAERPPKTTGREMFGRQFGEYIWQRGIALGLSGEDIVATLSMFTAASIAQAHRAFLPRPADEVIVSGGGAHNPTLMRFLAQALANCGPNGQPVQVLISDELGMPAQAKEAVAFAVLAYETWHGRPGNLPAATGAQHPVVLGSITPGRTPPPSGP